jgi:ribosomal protein S27E
MKKQNYEEKLEELKIPCGGCGKEIIIFVSKNQPFIGCPTCSECARSWSSGIEDIPYETNI